MQLCDVSLQSFVFFDRKQMMFIGEISCEQRRMYAFLRWKNK